MFPAGDLPGGVICDELGLPMEVEVLFDTPGEYIYYCILHGDNTGGRMAAKLTVNAAE